MQQKSELPEGWAWENIGNICKFIDYRGKTPKKSSSGIRLITARNVRMGHLSESPLEYITYEEYQNWMTRGFPKYGDILLTTEGPLGNVAELEIKERIALAQRVINLSPYCHILPKFIKYLLMSPKIQYSIHQKSTGTTVKGIKSSNLKVIQIPICPLPEQHRIISAIESLFTRLDATNEKLDRVPEILKKFRQSVLAAACDGKLTEKWREENQIKENSWSDLEFFDFCVLQRGYDLPISKRRDGPYPIMASSGVLAYHDECKASGPGVVVGRSGSTGKVHYTEEDYWPHNTTLFIKDFKENYPKFVYLFLINFNLEQYSASTAVPSLNRNNLRGIIVSIPPLHEQQEIVRRVDALFSFADSIESKIAAAREKTEKLRQSILAKAFSGELVETEAEIARREGRDYETAEVLLERIKVEGDGCKK